MKYSNINKLMLLNMQSLKQKSILLVKKALKASIISSRELYGEPLNQASEGDKLITMVISKERNYKKNHVLLKDLLFFCQIIHL